MVDQAFLADHRNPAGGFTFSDIPFIVGQDNFPLDDNLIRNIRGNWCNAGRDGNPDLGGCVPYLGEVGTFNTVGAFRANPYGAPAANYPTTGTGSPGIALAKESRTVGHATLDWQANRYNRVQVGGDFMRADAFTFNSASLTTQIFMDAAHYKPNRFGLYGTDRIDLGDVVIDLGLRYDRLNSNVLFPRTAGRLFSDPLRLGTAGLAKLVANHITPTHDDSLVAADCQAAITANDSTAISQCNLFPAAAHSVVEPSVRVSFPVTDHTGFRLSYAQQAQTPDFRFYAASVNTDLNLTNTNSTWGQDISYGKTILFEFGVRHAFSDDMVLDVSAYNKDKVSDVAGRVLPYLDPTTGTSQSINLFTNQDFGNVRGIDFTLDRRIGSLFQGRLSYTYESAKSTGSDPTEYLNSYSRQINAITGDRESPPQATLPTADSRLHTIAGNLVLNLPQGWRSGTTVGSIFQGFGAFATFRFASGLVYTPFPNLASGGTGPNNGFGLSGTPSAPLNSFRGPWTKNVDLRLTRGFQFGSRSLTAFADIRNLFNFTNITNFFVETGDIVNAKFQQKQVGSNSDAYTNFTSEFGGPTTTTINGHTVTGWDLRDASGTPCGNISINPGSDGNATDPALPDCIMMRRVEARFADPTDPNGSNLFLTQDELSRAYAAWYNRANGAYAFQGPGTTVRLGFEVNF
jgi:hypothetical protein